MFRSVLLAGAALAVPLTLAAAPRALPRPDPLDARAPLLRQAPVPSWRVDPLDADPEPADWREANQRVARIGGWRAYAREAAAPAPAAVPASGVPR